MPTLIRRAARSLEGDEPDSPELEASQATTCIKGGHSRALSRTREGPDGASRSRDFADPGCSTLARRNPSCDPPAVLATPSSACSADENEGGSGDEEPSEGRARECDSAEAAIQRALRCSAYAPSEVVGEGAYGCVWSGFVRAEPDRKVAIKHCIDPFRCKRDAVRSLREIRLLKLLKHPRIVELRSVVLPAGRDFTDLHLVFDLAECDLSKMVKSETIFDESHRRWILYQILQGCEYIHSRGVIHRDIKPANVLIDANCDIRIADFGMARALLEGDDTEDRIGWSVYVASRWYRPPELLEVACRPAGFGRMRTSVFKEAPYGTAMDIWGVGCIMYELWHRRPAFKGRTSPHQLQLIRDGVGTHAACAVKFADFAPTGAELLRQLLSVDPRHAGGRGRATAVAALQHPYFERLHGLRSARVPPGCRGRPLTALDFDFEGASVGMDELRRKVLEEAKQDNPLSLE